MESEHQSRKGMENNEVGERREVACVCSAPSLRWHV